jgi:rubrerythrin
MNLLAFLDGAITLEETIAACYGEMSRMAGDDYLAEDLGKLKGEEENHARVLKTGKDFVRKAADLFGVAIMGEAELQAGLFASRDLLDELRQRRVKLMEAIARMGDLELKFERLHMATVVSIADASLKGLFEQLSRDDRAHALVIGEILDRFR